MAGGLVDSRHSFSNSFKASCSMDINIVLTVKFNIYCDTVESCHKKQLKL